MNQTHIWKDILWQDNIVQILQKHLIAPVNAFLFIGPPGSNKEVAAKIFATALLCKNNGCGSCTSCLSAQNNIHSDLIEVQRTGASLSVAQAREVTEQANRMPSVGNRRVIILPEFHLVDDAAPALLKTIEESLASTFFIILADSITPQLVTIASRCVNIQFNTLTEKQILEYLLSQDIKAEKAERIARCCGQNIDKAIEAIKDKSIIERYELWYSIPKNLNRKGATIDSLVSSVLDATEQTIAYLDKKHEKEIEENNELAKEKRSSVTKTDLTARFKREQRKVRTDELRYGLKALSDSYRDVGLKTNPKAIEEALDYIDNASLLLSRNVTESLLLQALFIQLANIEFS